MVGGSSCNNPGIPPRSRFTGCASSCHPLCSNAIVSHAHESLSLEDLRPAQRIVVGVLSCIVFLSTLYGGGRVENISFAGSVLPNCDGQLAIFNAANGFVVVCCVCHGFFLLVRVELLSDRQAKESLSNVYRMRSVQKFSRLAARKFIAAFDWDAFV